MNIEEARSKLISFIDFYNKKPKEENRKFKMLQVDNIDIKAIETLLTAYEEKEKIIDEMAGYLAIIRDCPNENSGANLDCENRCNNDDDLIEECWKMYFERKIKYE